MPFTFLKQPPPCGRSLTGTFSFGLEHQLDNRLNSVGFFNWASGVKIVSLLTSCLSNIPNPERNYYDE